MESLEAAILRTVLYADVFNFSLNLAELQHFLIHDAVVSLSAIQDTLATSSTLKRLLTYEQGYIVLAGRADLIPVRIERERASLSLWQSALYWGMWLARLPFVRMVALTGALAVRNVPADDDDLDYLLVTQVGRVWLARALAIGLVRIGRLRGVKLCPNFVLAEDALEQERHSLFMAHEVVQMVPLYGQALYRRMRAANDWSADYLANSEGAFYSEGGRSIGRVWGRVKRVLETLLGGGLGDRLEAWEYRRKLRRFEQDMQTPHSSARLDPTQVKGHFNDHGHPVLRKYAELLRQYGLAEVSETMPGD